MTQDAALPLDFENIQRRFVQSVVSGGAAAPAVADIYAGKLSAQARLDIYRHNMQAVLGNVLSDLYPAVMSVVGKGFFEEAARQFLVATPSKSGDLNDYGESFAQFLATYPHASELPYLPDLAKLEWAWHRAFHAADEAPLDVGELAKVAPDALGGLVLGLHPAVSLLRSDHPLFRIWEVNQPGYEGAWAIEWDGPETYVAVFRQGLEVAIQTLNAAEHAMLFHIAAGEPLETVWAEIHKINSAFDLQGFLNRCVQSHVINKFWLPT